MTKHEFLTNLPEGARAPSEKEYELIDFVYNYHPSIHPVEGKKQIAMLYNTFGMRIILDMQETAKRAQEISNEIRKLRWRIEELEDEQQELSGI
ncbi:MAG: hypothetical protein ACI4JK_02215 [Oscillospiraceae bacterium]